jgi:hypothetical protein
MHLLCPQIHCSSVQHSLGAVWSVRWLTLIVSACTRLNPRTCIALSTADCRLSATVWCGLEREWLRRSLFQHSAASIRARIAQSTAVGCSAVQQVLVLPGRWWLDARCFSMHPPQSTHMHCQSTADSLQLSAAQSWCSLERDWLRRSVFQRTRLNHAHALLCPLRFSTRLGAARSWCGLNVSGYDARCFSIHTPPSAHTHCSSPLQLARRSAAKS